MNQIPAIRIIERTKQHHLLDLITIAICAVICGANKWVEVESYGKAKYEWLKHLCELPNGIPSHDTFAQVFARLNTDQLQQCFVNWMQVVRQMTQAQVITLDGKKLHHFFDWAEGKAAIHMVNAWASASRLLLRQVKVDEKCNEITAIPQLLKGLEVSGCIVTIDAIGCQKEIAELIIEQQADYVLALKGNQENLHEEVKWLFEQARLTEFVEIDHSFHQTIDVNNDRIEFRRYWTISELDDLTSLKQWKGLQSIGMVESYLRIRGQTTVETRYYITSLDNAEHLAYAACSQRGIENSLHWVLNVAFPEDDSRIRKDHTSQNFSLLHQIDQVLYLYPLAIHYVQPVHHPSTW